MRNQYRNKIAILCLVLAFLSTGCSLEKDLKDRAKIQTEEEIDAQNKNTEEWSKRLEVDLGKKRSFISSVEGEYEGEFYIQDSLYRLRVLLVANLPVQETNRTKTLDELEYELQTLSLRAQTTQWQEKTDFAFGCIFENIQPDIERGVFYLISENCSSSYELYLSSLEKSMEKKPLARKIAKDIQDQGVLPVSTLDGNIRSKNHSRVFPILMQAIQTGGEHEK